MAIAGSGSDAQAGAEIVELGVGDDAAPVQFRQFAQRLAPGRAGGVAVRLGSRVPSGRPHEPSARPSARLDGPANHALSVSVRPVMATVRNILLRRAIAATVPHQARGIPSRSAEDRTVHRITPAVMLVADRCSPNARAQAAQAPTLAGRLQNAEARDRSPSFRAFRRPRAPRSLPAPRSPARQQSRGRAQEAPRYVGRLAAVVVGATRQRRNRPQAHARRVGDGAAAARLCDPRVHSRATSRALRRGLPGDVPLGLLERRGQTLALSRAGQPDAVMCLLRSS